MLAVYRLDVARIVDSVPELLAQLPPLEALRRWTTELVNAMRMKHGLGDALSPGSRQAVTEESYEPVIGAIGRMLDAGTSDGTIRADADPADFLLLTAALWRAPAGDQDRSGRMLSLVLDGLRAEP